MAAKRVATGEAAAALGKNRRTLQRWAKRQGFPVDAAGLVDVEELRAWAGREGLLDLVQGEKQDPVDALTAGSPRPPAPDPRAELRVEHAREKLGLDAARRKLQEAKAAKAAGELVPFDQVRRFWARQAQTLKTGLEAAGPQVAGAVLALVAGGCPADERLEHEVGLLIRDAHDEVLAQLAADVEVESA